MMEGERKIRKPLESSSGKQLGTMLSEGTGNSLNPGLSLMDKEK